MPFIPLETFTNAAQTTVSAGGTTVPAPSGGTIETWTVASSASFPAAEYGSEQFHVADAAAPSEIITVLAVTGTTWTVQRGAENTVPVTHQAGFTVWQVITAGVLAALQYPPWQFPVQAFGAQGDGRVGTGGTGTAGSSAFTDAAASFINAPAPAGDVGKVIIINTGAGSATTRRTPWCGSITAVTSPTSVTLSGTLNANATSAPYIFGTDDSASIQAAVDAAETWARTTGNFKAQVVFEPLNYMLAALTQTTVPYHYNTHIKIPFSSQYEQRLTLDLLGTGDAAEPMFWGSSTPLISGTCLVSAVYATGQPNGTYGRQSVIGTPSTSDGIGTGGIPTGAYANVLVNISGITVVAPYNAQQCGYDLRYAAQANLPVAAAVAFAPVNYNAQPCGGTWLRLSTYPDNGVAIGLAMPESGNNDNCNLGEVAIEGFAIGVTFNEHFTATRLAEIYCGTAISLTLGGIAHGADILYWSCEGCDTGISAAGAGGGFVLNIFHADFEAIGSVYVDDPGDTLCGTMFFDGLDSTPYQSAGITGATRYRVLSSVMHAGIWAADASRGIPGPPAAPGTGTPQQNTSGRDATVYLSATTGITGVSAGPASGSLTALGLTAGNNVVTQARVPAGHWYSVAFTGVLTVKWYLD